MQLVIYGIDGAVETEESVSQEPLSTYIGTFVVPGGGEIPASFIVYEVAAGDMRTQMSVLCCAVLGCALCCAGLGCAVLDCAVLCCDVRPRA